MKCFTPGSLSAFPGPHVLYSLLDFFYSLYFLLPKLAANSTTTKQKSILLHRLLLHVHPNWTLTAGKNCGNQGKIIKKELKEHNRGSPGNAALWQRCTLAMLQSIGWPEPVPGIPKPPEQHKAELSMGVPAQQSWSNVFFRHRAQAEGWTLEDEKCWLTLNALRLSSAEP